MKVEQSGQRLRAEHGVIASFPRDFFGYFGWPTVARTDSGVLLVAASGLRNDHVCPFGRTVVCHSGDGGESWSSPRVVHDSPLDDRDAGLLSLGGEKLLLSFFTTDGRRRARARGRRAERWQAGLARVGDEQAAHWIGSWVCHSDDGGQHWQAPLRVPLSAPHGPVALQTGALLYLGKYFAQMDSFARGEGPVAAMRSSDGGRTWEPTGFVPLLEETVEAQYHEAHAVELEDGRLLGLIRFQEADGGHPAAVGAEPFSMLQTFSDDRGHTWSAPEPLKFHGSPPHLLRHSSGTLVCTYGYRRPPYGQRAMLSGDGGESWTYDYVLRDDGPDADLGYPSSVELEDGSLLSVYYQKLRQTAEKCSLLWTRWWLP